jgi:hypothetical protein
VPGLLQMERFQHLTLGTVCMLKHQCKRIQEREHDEAQSSKKGNTALSSQPPPTHLAQPSARLRRESKLLTNCLPAGSTSHLSHCDVLATMPWCQSNACHLPPDSGVSNLFGTPRPLHKRFGPSLVRQIGVHIIYADTNVYATDLRFGVPVRLSSHAITLSDGGYINKQIPAQPVPHLLHQSRHGILLCTPILLDSAALHCSFCTT